MNDTERLNYLLTFIAIDDVGDEFAVPGIIVKSEELEESLSWGKPEGERNRTPSLAAWGDDLRDVIDRAIAAHTATEEDDNERL